MLIQSQNTDRTPIYFQPEGIKSNLCEVGMILDSDPDYIYYMEEPCKVHISEVKVIPRDQVMYDPKNRVHRVKLN